jgi:hypothetical protein
MRPASVSASPRTLVCLTRWTSRLCNSACVWMNSGRRHRRGIPGVYKNCLDVPCRWAVRVGDCHEVRAASAPRAVGTSWDQSMRWTRADSLLPGGVGEERVASSPANLSRKEALAAEDPSRRPRCVVESRADHEQPAHPIDVRLTPEESCAPQAEGSTPCQIQMQVIRPAIDDEGHLSGPIRAVG